MYVFAYKQSSWKRQEISIRTLLHERVRSFGGHAWVVVLVDLNAWVENEAIEVTIGRHEVPGRNDRGEEVCAEHVRGWKQFGQEKCTCG